MAVEKNKEAEYPCPNCDSDKPQYREPCPECNYDDKKMDSQMEK